jgi:TonB family protein
MTLSATMLALVAALQPTGPQDPRPIQPLAALVSDADYPPGAIQREASGTVGFTLDIDAGGAPTHCTVTQSADPELDQRTCEIFMARARFQPALDAGGQAVPGSIASRLRWIFPEEETVPFVPARLVIAIRARAGGEVECALSVNGSAVEWPDAAACAAFAPMSRRGDSRGGYTLTGVFTASQQGEAPPPIVPSADYGDLLYEDAATLSVAPDGHVTDCRIISHHVLRTLSAGAMAPDLCAPGQLGLIPRFAPAPQSAGFRIVRLSFSAYLRTSRRR